MNSVRTRVGDIDMSYTIEGEGSPFLSIRGFGAAKDATPPEFRKVLSSNHRVICYDNRGIGESTAGNRGVTIEQLADDVAGLLEKLEIDKAHVFGISMGGMIAQELALRHPEKVDHLFLSSTYCGPGGIPISPEDLEKLQDSSGTPREQAVRAGKLLFPAAWLERNLEQFMEMSSGLTQPSPEILAEQAAAIESWDGACDRLPLIENPTLVAAGAEDVLIRPKNSEIMAERIHNSKLLILEEVAHAITWQIPVKCAELVLEFLGE